jgi:hypothetical protein
MLYYSVRPSIPALSMGCQDQGLNLRAACEILLSSNLMEDGNYVTAILIFEPLNCAVLFVCLFVFILQLQLSDQMVVAVAKAVVTAVT